jgi:hypothetical protein
MGSEGTSRRWTVVGGNLPEPRHLRSGGRRGRRASVGGDPIQLSVLLCWVVMSFPVVSVWGVCASCHYIPDTKPIHCCPEKNLDRSRALVLYRSTNRGEEAPLWRLTPPRELTSIPDNFNTSWDRFGRGFSTVTSLLSEWPLGLRTRCISATVRFGPQKTSTDSVRTASKAFVGMESARASALLRSVTAFEVS